MPAKMSRAISFAVAAILIVMPLVSRATATNPPLARTGAPGESTCASCHNGGANTGSVSLSLSGGSIYTPSTVQQIRVTVSDPNAAVWGYELTAVQANATTTGAGTFTAGDGNSAVRKGTGANINKYYAAQTNAGVSSFLINWTPPAASVGNVVFYVAAVGGDGSGDESGDSVYTANTTLTPVSVGLPSMAASPASLSFVYTQNGTTPAAQTLALSSGGVAASYTLASSATWLSATPASGTTPGSASVSINPAGLAPGSYTGNVTVTSAGVSNSPLAVPVTLVVAAAPSLTVSPSTLSFTAQAGGTSPPAQSVSVSGGTALSYTTSSSATWLSASPASGATPGSVSVSANPAGLVAGTYTGTVSIAAVAAGNSPQTVAVTFIVTAAPLPNLTLSPSTLSFTAQAGAAVPAAQTVAVTSSGAALSYTTSSSATWLTASPASGATPGSVSVSVNQAGLAAGTYTGTISVASAGAANSPRTVAVTFIVTAAALPNLALSPASLSFAAQTGAAAPAAQSVAVTSTGAALSYTVTTTSSATWLTASPASGATPGTISVSVNSAGLTPGTYNGSVSVASAGAANSPQTVPVTLVVTSPGTGTLLATPSTLTFYVGGEVEDGRLHQRLRITSSGTPLAFTALVHGATWLAVGSSGGTTPATLTVTVHPHDLAAGSYTALVELSSPNAATITVPVTLVIRKRRGEDEHILGANSYISDPRNTGSVVAKWLSGAGVPSGSSTDPANQGLVLLNNVSASSETRAGIVLKNIEGTTLNALGFDIRQGSLCTANGPRFIIETNDDVVHTLGGCNEANIQQAPATGWRRFRFDPAQAEPSIAPDAVIKSISLMMDEGPEANSGMVVLDNININGKFIEKE